MMGDGYAALSPTDLTADLLDWATASDSTDANVGEVGALILGVDGQVRQIVNDAGGFLGMGAKPVALPLDQVDIFRKDDGSDMCGFVALTKEQLEARTGHQISGIPNHATCLRSARALSGISRNAPSPATPRRSTC
jgi:PRC-barrel domain